MIRIKSWNTAYWGFIRTSRDGYECHPKVNAFIGPSGGGKTTLMDAIRIALGDARFENNRAMDHYIHPKSNWAVVKVTFGNSEEEGRPFYSVGYRRDEVTACVRLNKTNVKSEREYYVFDGEFEDIIELGKEPSLYKRCKLGYKEYLKLLEGVGITESFRRLMMMRPEDIQNVVDLQPYDLFKKIFELKGQKEIQDTHDDTQQKVRQIMNQEEITARDLRVAEEKLGDYEEKKRFYDENKLRKEEHEKLHTLLLKRRYWDSDNTLNNQNKERKKLEKEHEQLIQEEYVWIDHLWIMENELKNKKLDLETRNEKLKQVEDEKIKKSNKVAILNEEIKLKINVIKELEDIKEESKDNLERELATLKNDFNVIGYKRSKFIEDKEFVEDNLKKLAENKSTPPFWVERYQEALNRDEIPKIMLGDCISVKEEYIPWIEAIEGLLGKERFRTIIPDTFQLQAKKLQQEYEYGARVSREKSAKRPINSTLLEGKFVSVRKAIDVDNEPEIAGYLEWLNDVYLVNDVEDGHILQAKGYKTITKKGLLQDNDGALFLKVKELICGRLSREKYREQLEFKLNIVNNDLEKITIQLNNKRENIKLIEERLNRQKEREKLPQLLLKREENENLFKIATNELNVVEKQYDELDTSRNQTWQSIELLATSYNNELWKWKDLLNQVSQMESSLIGYTGNIAKWTQSLKAAENELKNIGYDDQALAFIDIQVKEEKIFDKKDGGEWTLEILEDRVRELFEAIERFKLEYKDINEAIIAMVEPQKEHVAKLRGDLEKTRIDREEWQVRLNDAELALRLHVRETMHQYIEEFMEMAEKLGAKAWGKFNQDGDHYTQWQLMLKLAFDGKELRPYYDPIFSKGQRAAISIMMLLAAVNNKHEGSSNSIMFLDEPTSRVDDYRASEIGQVLQSTNIQYFITHQISATLTTVEWIDYGYVTSKLRDGEEFADNLIFEARRAV